MKKPAGLVWFRFYKQKTNQTEPKPTKNRKKNRAKTGKNRENRAKTGKTEPNRFEPVFALKKQKPNRNRSVWPGFGFGFFSKKNSVWLLFFIKTEPNRKWSLLLCDFQVYEGNYGVFKLGNHFLTPKSS